MKWQSYGIMAALLAVCASTVASVIVKKAPVVIADTLWSKPDRGIRGRLVVEKGAPCNGTPQIQVYLELQNVSDVADPIHITPGRSVSFEVVDSKGNVVAPAGLPVDVTTPDDPFGLVLPYRSTLRFLLSVRGIGVPKDKKWQVSVPHGSSFRSWVIERTDEHAYFLRGGFKAAGERQVSRTWPVALSLPRVPVAASEDN